MRKMRLLSAEKQPQNISVPTFFNSIKDYMPSVLNSDALKDSSQQLGNLSTTINNSITNVMSKQDPKTVNEAASTVSMQLNQLLSIMQTKLQGGQADPSVKGMFEQVKSYNDQISKWMGKPASVPALPVQPAQMIDIPQAKPFAKDVKGPRKVPVEDVKAPLGQQQRQDAAKTTPQTQQQQQEPVITKQDAYDAADEVVAASFKPSLFSIR